MKKFLILSLLLLVCNPGLWAQKRKVVYDSAGKKKNITSSTLNLTFTPYDGKAIIGEAAIAAAAIDLGIYGIEKALENRKAKFTGEYSMLGKNDAAAPDKLYQLTFTHNGKVNDLDQDVLKVVLSPNAASNSSFFYYSVETIDLKYSKARRKKKDDLDFTIQLELSYLINGEKKTLTLNPIALEAVTKGIDPLKKGINESEAIVFPKGATLIEASIKIVQSNPRVVKIEKITKLFSDNKDILKALLKGK